ncbi:chromosomal replication initiator protein DnaA [Ureaplasma ceti]|uniref:Chromosomal replication initiator protein DnaA n=1 Tax=Ureaplasma ceti TaxID=3119530 RepID=A0ABP9UBV4_9BACT
MYTKEQLIKFWKDALDKFSNVIGNPLLFNEVYVPTKVYNCANNTLFILVPDKFTQNELFIKKDQLEEVFKQVSNSNLVLDFVLDEQTDEIDKLVTRSQSRSVKSNNSSSSNHVSDLELQNMNLADTFATSSDEISEDNNINLNGLDTQLSFASYVVGNFNKNAYSILMKVLADGSTLFNPVYIYGATGLGKTHLISSFTNEFIKKYPTRKVCYIDSSTFIKEVSNALYRGNNQIENLKDKFSNYDLFVFEDIQYLSDKSKTNEIFLNIFNNLIKEEKIILVTADRPANQLIGFEDRMISRLSSGISSKIKDPDFSSLRTIIHDNFRKESIEVTDGAIDFLTNYFNRDIRQLNGMINKIIFFTSIEKDKNIGIIDETRLSSILDLDSNKNKKALKANPNTVINAVAKIYNLKTQDIVGKSRKRNYTLARHVAMYILREVYEFQLKEIGTFLNNRDHTTVLNGVQKVKDQIVQDKDLENFINSIVKSL